MIFRKAARHARELLAFEPAVERPLELRRLDDGAEVTEVGGDLLAYFMELRRLGRIHAAANPDAVERDMEIHAGSAALAELAMPEARGDIRLVRLFVLRKADVAVNAVDRLRTDVELRRDAAHVDRQPLDDRDHRLADDGLVLVAARVEPFAPVVALQARQKRQRVFTESGRNRHHVTPSTRRLKSFS